MFSVVVPVCLCLTDPVSHPLSVLMLISQPCPVPSHSPSIGLVCSGPTSLHVDKLSCILIHPDAMLTGIFFLTYLVTSFIVFFFFFVQISDSNMVTLSASLSHVETLDLRGCKKVSACMFSLDLGGVLAVGKAHICFIMTENATFGLMDKEFVSIIPVHHWEKAMFITDTFPECGINSGSVSGSHVTYFEDRE